METIRSFLKCPYSVLFFNLPFFFLYQDKLFWPKGPLIIFASRFNSRPMNQWEVCFCFYLWGTVLYACAFLCVCSVLLGWLARKLTRNDDDDVVACLVWRKQTACAPSMESDYLFVGCNFFTFVFFGHVFCCLGAHHRFQHACVCKNTKMLYSCVFYRFFKCFCVYRLTCSILSDGDDFLANCGVFGFFLNILKPPCFTFSVILTLASHWAPVLNMGLSTKPLCSRHPGLKRLWSFGVLSLD